MDMRRLLLALVTMFPTMLAGAVVVPALTESASASCVAPQLVGRPITLERGESETVRGRYFQDGCADVIVCDEDGDCSPLEEVSPSVQVKLRLFQNGRSWVLDRSDANVKMRIHWDFELPRGVKAGTAWLKARNAQRVRVTIG